MKLPTLDEFIKGYDAKIFRSNLYVREKGFRSLYVRIGPRYIGKNKIPFDPTLDIANVAATYPGKGYFTRLVERLRRDYPHLGLYVETVFEDRFRRKLLRLGFEAVGLDCFFLNPK